tara:strand:+ start:1601 stop:2287 length:687 start_codon:yes stop_codon:yes gene_type:complete
MGWGSFDPRGLRRAGYAAKQGRMTNADFNRLKRGVYVSAASAFVENMTGSPQLVKNFEALEEKLRLKVIQTAIKPLVRQSVRVWKTEISQAKSSGRSNAFRRKFAGVSLRKALAKSIKAVMPSGRGEKSLRGYGILKGTATKHGKRGQAVTNAGQAMWLEWGTKERQHKSGKSTGKMEPLTQVRRKIKAMQPQARRVFAEALRQSIAAQGQNRITATQGRQMFERFAK